MLQKDDIKRIYEIAREVAREEMSKAQPQEPTPVKDVVVAENTAATPVYTKRLGVLREKKTEKPPGNTE